MEHLKCDHIKRPRTLTIEIIERLTIITLSMKKCLGNDLAFLETSILSADAPGFQVIATNAVKASRPPHT